MNALVVLLFLAASPLHFDITDARGKKPSGVWIEVSEPDGDGWRRLKPVTKGKGNPVIVWPFDGQAKAADGPGDIPAIVMEPGDDRALSNPRLVAALAASDLLGAPHSNGLDATAVSKAITQLARSDEAFQKGVGLLYEKKPIDALDYLARALRERERQLTRVPSEIYPAAILYGQALMEALKFDDAAVAFLKAIRQRPSDELARKLRSEALARAGKPEAQ